MGVSTARSAGITHRSARLRAHLALARVSNTPTVVSNVLAGAALATTLGLDWNVVLVTLAMVLFYTGGMYLNDIFDREFDRRHRPDRPIPSGAVSLSAAGIVTVGLFVVGLLLLGVAHRAALVSGIVLLIVIAAYDAWHKTNPVGPFIMAATRSLVYITAFLAYSTDITTELVVWSFLMLFYVAGLTSIAKTETGLAGLRSWPLAGLVAPAISALIAQLSVSVLLAAVVFLGWAVYSASFVYVESRRSIGGAITRLIAGISLLDAMVLATHEAWWGVAIALVAFVATLFFQRYIRGT